MELIELFEKDKQEYNAFVAACVSGSFLQSWEWGEWQAALGRQVKRLKINDENGDVVGVVQLIQTPLFMGKHYWYAPYGPVVRKSENQKIRNLEVTVKLLKENFPASIFIRIEPQDKSLILDLSSLTKSTNIQPAITMVVDLQKPDEELLGAMHPKTRYNIKVAEKHGVAVQSDLVVMPQHGLYVKEALDLIVQTQVRQKYRGHSASYYKNLVDFFALKNQRSDLKVIIYKALWNKQLLATGIMIDFGKVRMYLYGGSSEENKNVMAPYLLHWQAMKDARALGMNIYDLGGSEVASGGERGFTRFKQGFGRRVITYAGAYDIINKSLWYNVYRVARWLNRLLK